MSSSKKPDELLPTRKSLLSRLKNFEDNKSWQEFFDTYWKLIYGVAMKTGLSDTEAQEVVQKTVIEVSKRIKDFKYDPSKSFKAWLLTNTRWRIAEQFKERTPGNHNSSQTSDATVRTSTIDRIPNSNGYDLEAKWDSEWRVHAQQTVMERVKRKVNAKHYQIFDAHVVKGWPVEKVSATLGVSDDLVYKVKERVTKLIKEDLGRLEQVGQ